MQLRQLIVCGADVGANGPSGQPAARTAGLVDGLGPGPVQLHDLGSADETRAAKRDHVRVRGAPAGERGRPLLRAAPVEQLVTGADHAAVDDAGDHGRDFAARDGEHHLVEQREPLGLPPHLEERAAHAVARQRRHVRVLQPRADLGGAVEGGVGGFGVALDGLLESQRAEQVSPFRAVLRGVVEEAADAREPAAGLCLLIGAIDEDEHEPEGAAGRQDRIAPVQMALIRARARVDALPVSACQVGRRREAVEILRGERRLGVRRGQAVVGVGPGFTIECRAGVGQCAGHVRMIAQRLPARQPSWTRVRAVDAAGRDGSTVSRRRRRRPQARSGALVAPATDAVARARESRERR